MINIEVYSTHAVIRSQQPLTVGLTGASAHFAFGKPWDQLIKTAVFRQGEKTVTVADIGQQVQIPWEVLTLPGVPMMIGVYGTDTEGKLVIPTLWAETEPVRPGADPQGGVTPADPTAPVWAQLQSNMGSREQLNTNDKTSLVAAINEANRPLCWVKVSQKEDGSYDYSHNSLRIMNALSAGSTVFCQLGTHYLLSLVYATPGKCIFTGVYDGDLYAVTVTSTGATVTTTPLSSGGGGSDGITPHIGANGNWWIGEEDTGVSAGVTDEQISGAVEEYMKENPLVKTVNGTEPDENGNVELGISSGGDVWEELINVTTEEEVSKVETTLDNPGKFKIISVYLVLRNVTTNTALTVTVDINSPFIWTPNEAYTICQVPLFGGANQTDLKFFGTVLFTPSHVISQGYVWNRQQLVCNPNPNITADAVASTITVATQNNVNLFGVGSIIKVYGVRA